MQKHVYIKIWMNLTRKEDIHRNFIVFLFLVCILRREDCFSAILEASKHEIIHTNS